MESVFAALKKMYGDCTRCRRPDSWTREISIRTICYNIELVAKSQAKDGRPTQYQIATLATQSTRLISVCPAEQLHLGFG